VKEETNTTLIICRWNQHIFVLFLVGWAWLPIPFFVTTLGLFVGAGENLKQQYDACINAGSLFRII
jgi:hypothetical protein